MTGAEKQKIVHTHINQEQLGARLGQCTVIEQRELMGFLLEFLLISAVAELVRQGTAEAVRVWLAIGTSQSSALPVWRIDKIHTRRDTPDG